MDAQAIKIELVKLILELDNPSLIKKIRDLLAKETSEFQNSLTEQERFEVQLGLNQLNKGQRISFEDFLKKVF